MDAKNNRVAAVVVTYNRVALLKECLQALLQQTTPLTKIIVVNNGSTDETKSWLDEVAISSAEKLVIIHQANTGGAGGFYTGIKQAYESGYDLVWVMDDDCIASKDCLAELLASSEEEILAYAPKITDRNNAIQTGHRGNVFFSQNLQQLITPLPESNYVNNTYVDFASFVGLMIKREVIEKIGLPIPEFFITNDDFEYCLRISKYSKIKLCVNAEIRHLEAANKNVKKRFLNYQRERVLINNLWLRYYGVRNLIWVKNKYFTKSGFLSKSKFYYQVVKTFLTHITGIWLLDDNKIKRSNFLFNAYVDGLRGKFDNAKPKQILKGAK